MRVYWVLGTNIRATLPAQDLCDLQASLRALRGDAREPAPYNTPRLLLDAISIFGSRQNTPRVTSMNPLATMHAMHGGEVVETETETSIDGRVERIAEEIAEEIAMQAGGTVSGE